MTKTFTYEREISTVRIPGDACTQYAISFRTEFEVHTETYVVYAAWSNRAIHAAHHSAQIRLFAKWLEVTGG